MSAKKLALPRVPRTRSTLTFDRQVRILLGIVTVVLISNQTFKALGAVKRTGSVLDQVFSDYELMIPTLTFLMAVTARAIMRSRE